MNPRRFVILDRDGTVMVERHYLSDPREVELLPGAVNGLRRMREMDLGLILITNQSGIGRGYFDTAALGRIHQRLCDLLRAEGVELDGIYFCPHAPEDRCVCRKPNPGLLEQASREFGFDPGASFVIGDKDCDIDLGRAVGAKTILVRTGYGEEMIQARHVSADFIAEDLLDGARIIRDLLEEETVDGKKAWRESAPGRARAHLAASMEVKARLVETCLEPIVASAERIAEAFESGGKALLCGNGGSASDCQHMATEFVSRLTRDFDRPGLPAMALTADTSFLTAFTNDCGFEAVFERQVKTFGREGDVLIGISTSGNSENVVRAVEAARAAKMTSIVLTGEGGRLAGMADIAISVPSGQTQHIQEAHLMIEHLLCDLVERCLFGESKKE